MFLVMNVWIALRIADSVTNVAAKFDICKFKLQLIAHKNLLKLVNHFSNFLFMTYVKLLPYSPSLLMTSIKKILVQPNLVCSDLN